MTGTVTIDFLPESASRFREGYAVVAVDVIRATTTATTAVETGRRCFPVPSIEYALPIAAMLDQPLLAGELGGNTPYGFEVTNSPAEVAAREDTWRPMILLSSSGTQLIHNAGECEAAYLASFRNLSATVAYLAERHPHVAVIGAGTRGEFREEDQACCARIASGLVEAGYAPRDAWTETILRRWSDASPYAWMESKSVEYLRRTGQLRDLDFILAHWDDLKAVFRMEEGEVTRAPASHRARRVVKVPAAGG